MRILMLGWEFQPFIAGGLGVACQGLVKGLDQLGHEVVFILPKPVAKGEEASAKLVGPESLPRGAGAKGGADSFPQPPMGGALDDLRHATFHGVHATFQHTYPKFDPAPAMSSAPAAAPGSVSLAPGVPSSSTLEAAPAPSAKISVAPAAEPDFPSLDLIDDAERYARLVVALASREKFDLVHAHDWLTFPAGIAVSKVSGKPLVVHVHSTEFDRAGNNVNQRIYEAERAGMHAATRVVAVSEFTRSICVRRYGVDASRVDVVYNGLERAAPQPQAGARIGAKDKIVLFLGRLTMQKGPEYFVAAAKRVLEKRPDVKFVLAGSGDMAVRMIELAASMGIGGSVLFTGFLRGEDVEKIYNIADCYVMPSVSEPFGLAALDAVRHDVPTIVSKTSGVSEVLKHVLKVDFWDIDEIANKILAVLSHPPLAQTLVRQSGMELEHLTWDRSAARVVETYRKALGAKK